MNSRDYWAKREEENLKHYLKDEEAYEKEVQKIYTRTLANVQKEINAFYGNYAKKENISLAEAKKRVSTLDIKAYEAKAEQYVKDRTFSKQANEEMRLYNATMRINRLEMLKANIGLELIAGHDDLEKFMEGILKGRTEEELKRQAGILGKTITNNAQMVHSIVNSSFHNATFSDRIWMYQTLLRSDLEIQLSRGMIQGKNPRELARSIKERFDVRTSDAERLMRTELARVQTEAQKQSFIRNGFTQYMFIVNGGCCDICEEIKGKIYDVKDMQPGENAPPMHPHCRCSIAAYEDSKEYEAWLDFLDKGGTTAEWNKTGKAKWQKVASKATGKNGKNAKVKAEQYDIEGGTTKIKATMDGSDYKAYVGMIKNCAVEGAKKLYSKYADSLSGIKRVTNGGAYKPSLNSIEYDFETNHAGLNKFTTLAHEMGHFFDVKAQYKNLHFAEVDTINSRCVVGTGATKMLKRGASTSDEFLNAVRADKAEMAKLFSKDNNFGADIKTEFRKNHASSGVQDAIDGMLGVRIAWGHGDAYYNRKYSSFKTFGLEKELKTVYKEIGYDASNQAKVKNLCRDYETASELYANISSAIVCGGDELTYIQKYLPNSYAAVLKIYEGVD